MAKKQKADGKISVGDVVTLPVDFTIVGFGPLDKDGNEVDSSKTEVSLTPVDAHVTHLTVKKSELPS